MTFRRHQCAIQISLPVMRSKASTEQYDRFERFIPLFRHNSHLRKRQNRTTTAISNSKLGDQARMQAAIKPRNPQVPQYMYSIYHVARSIFLRNNGRRSAIPSEKALVLAEKPRRLYKNSADQYKTAHSHSNKHQIRPFLGILTTVLDNPVVMQFVLWGVVHSSQHFFGWFRGRRRVDHRALLVKGLRIFAESTAATLVH